MEKLNEKIRGERRVQIALAGALVLMAGFLAAVVSRPHAAQPQESEPAAAVQDAVLDTEDTREGADWGEDWMLVLVNDATPMEAGYVPELEEIENGYSFDARAADALYAMLEDGRSQGMQVVIYSAFRTVERQAELFDNQVRKQMLAGYDGQEAEAVAKTLVQYPGHSEHNLGLAVDLVAASYQQLDEEQEKTQEYQWLLAHCHEYGFILRYPNGKTGITGVSYEPWHFRYVGETAAAYIMENDLTLEEFLEEIGQ